MSPISGACGPCGAPMVSNYYWRRMDAAERAELLELGIKPRRGGQCHNCVETRRRREQAEREGPSTARYKQRELLSEWASLVDHTVTMRENCRRLAPRLGMRSQALERALQRAGVRAWPTDWAKRAITRARVEGAAA